MTRARRAARSSLSSLARGDAGEHAISAESQHATDASRRVAIAIGYLQRYDLTIFPGFMRLSGSSARLIVRITSSAGPCSASMNFILP